MSRLNEFEPLAFPCDSREARNFCGMTLRDYFAAKSIPIATSFTKETEGTWPGWGEIAKSAYNLADAMLAEREKK